MELNDSFSAYLVNKRERVKERRRDLIDVNDCVYYQQRAFKKKKKKTIKSWQLQDFVRSTENNSILLPPTTWLLLRNEPKPGPK